MTSTNDTGAILSRPSRLAEGTGGPAPDVFGPIIEFLTPEENEQICVMRAVVPPGVTVPLHSHDDFEASMLAEMTSHRRMRPRVGSLQPRTDRRKDCPTGRRSTPALSEKEPR